MKSIRIKWAGCGARMVKINAYKIFLSNPEGDNHLGDLGVDGMIILVKWILKKEGLGLWTG
jgi:hypothetical protein